MVTSIEIIQDEADDEPHEEAKPIFDGEAGHQDEAEDERRNRNPGRPRDAETARTLGLRLAQNDDGDGNEDEGKKSADVREIDERSYVENARGDGNENSGDPGGNVRRAEAFVNSAEGFRKQAVARHREP